jgi:hypothetical protein
MYGFKDNLLGVNIQCGRVIVGMIFSVIRGHVL